MNFYHLFLCGYRKSFSSQYALLSLTEQCKILFDKKEYAGAVHMNISAFGSINHKILSN